MATQRSRITWPRTATTPVCQKHPRRGPPGRLCLGLGHLGYAPEYISTEMLIGDPYIPLSLSHRLHLSYFTSAANCSKNLL